MIFVIVLTYPVSLTLAHGTFIGSIRLEGKKPQQVPIDSEIHFGASTRMYVIRERPQTIAPTVPSDDKMGEEIEGGLLGLPETETELDVGTGSLIKDQSLFVDVLNCVWQSIVVLIVQHLHFAEPNWIQYST